MSTAVDRRYRREFLRAMAAYAVVLFAAAYALKSVEAPWLRIVLSLVPMVPIAFAAKALLRYMRDCDELQRRIHLDALALASLVLTFGSFSMGLLAVNGLLSLSGEVVLIWILPSYCLLFGLFSAITSRRYR